jgi:hypothetical protein
MDQSAKTKCQGQVCWLKNAKTQQDSTAMPRVACMHASSEDQTLACGSVCNNKMPEPSFLAEEEEQQQQQQEKGFYKKFIIMLPTSHRVR